MTHAILAESWAFMMPLLRAHFPNFTIPDVPPVGEHWNVLMSDLAIHHDLTEAETKEMIEDLSFLVAPPERETIAA